ncbi:hypothetical protein JVT61DRAFT_11643 [Boletus reticuloceps]|uniref:Bacteriophage T5 Orf172 DNA-binding domain-containing protein n=1 Tax=Boletus reticuloceps TaxID=495285 RepID=A0A8I2YW93_9AGAM|nr:hypothetical protein JVT61DRAFT_11643 [Boletus reticuloceps]
MNKPLPVPPKRYDLVESFDALALAGKKPIEKKLPDPPPPGRQPGHQNSFVGGFSPEVLALNAALDSHRRPPLVIVSPPSAISMPIPMPVPQASKHSLTMQYALGSMRPDTPTKSALAPPFVTVPPRPRSDPIVSPKAASKLPLSAVTGPSQPTLSVTPSRPRAVSVPARYSPRRNTTQCGGTTKTGKQCSRQVKLPATHSHLDPTPVLYCHQHKEVMITAQTGFYVRNAGNPDRFVEFSHYIPKYLQVDTQLALRVEMEKATSPADVPGYIYTFEIRDPKRPDVIQLKVGRAVNLVKRLDQWDKQCGSKIQIPRGSWPGTVEDDDGTGGSLLKGNIKPGEPGPFCHRVERLVHIELTDLSLHVPYLNPGWPNNTSDPSSGAGTTTILKKTTPKETTCLDCGAVHREIFTFLRPDKGVIKERNGI